MFLFAYLSVSLIGRMRDMALALNGFSLDYICKNKTDSSSLQIPFSVIIWHFSPQMLILYKQIMLLQAQTKYTLCHLIWNINVSPNLHLFSLLILWVVCLWIIDISFLTAHNFQSALRETVQSQQVLEQPLRHFSYRLSRISSNAQAVMSLLSYNFFFRNTNYI